MTKKTTPIASQARKTFRIEEAPGYYHSKLPLGISAEVRFEKALSLKLENADDAVQAVKEGIPVALATRLGEYLDVSMQTLSRVTNIAERTLVRRKSEKGSRLKVDESERVLRIGLLLDRAVEVLGGLEAARAWLSTPCKALGNNLPLEYADTEPGAREVENLLGRIEHGVFS